MPASDQRVTEEKYYISPRVLIFLFNHQGDVLLIKGGPHKRLWPGLYNGIGGHIEPGEDILAAAHRELWEEAAIGDVQLDLVGTIMVDVQPAFGVGLYLFTGFYEEQVSHPSDEGLVAWVPLNQIKHLPIMPDLLEIIPAILDARQHQKMLYGHAYYDQAHQGEMVVSFR